MGVDIDSDEGVIGSVDDVMGMLREKDKNNIIRICRRFYYFNDDDDFFQVFESLTRHSTFEEVIAALRSTCQALGKPSKYGSDDCRLSHEWEICDLWVEILGTVRPDLPVLANMKVFDSARYNGWDVPLGVVCFIFDSEQCFNQSLTNEGKALKKAMGHCDSTTWTSYSI